MVSTSRPLVHLGLQLKHADFARAHRLRGVHVLLLQQQHPREALDHVHALSFPIHRRVQVDKLSFLAFLH